MSVSYGSGLQVKGARTYRRATSAAAHSAAAALVSTATLITAASTATATAAAAVLHRHGLRHRRSPLTRTCSPGWRAGGGSYAVFASASGGSSRVRARGRTHAAHAAAHTETAHATHHWVAHHHRIPHHHLGVPAALFTRRKEASVLEEQGV